MRHDERARLVARVVVGGGGAEQHAEQLHQRRLSAAGRRVEPDDEGLRRARRALRRGVGAPLLVQREGEGQVRLPQVGLKEERGAVRGGSRGAGARNASRLGGGGRGCVRGPEPQVMSCLRSGRFQPAGEPSRC